MDVAGHCEAKELSVNISEMADIVHRLIAGGVSTAWNAQWLRERAEVAGLSGQEYEALESLRVRLSRGGAALLQVDSIWWP
jgi:hypothetical protein